jgi:hypothetical protein
MFSFLKKIKIPKTTLTCLAIVAIVLVILYLQTDFFNKAALPFEHYEDEESCPATDTSVACNLQRAYKIATA